MANGHLVVVTGPAAAGKSTLSRALQAERMKGGELYISAGNYGGKLGPFHFKLHEIMQ